NAAMSADHGPILWEHPLSPYAQKVKIALREKGVPFSVRMPAGIGAGASEAAFAAASPRREVPALEHGPVTIFDSRIIVDYIEDVWPQPAILPSDPAARARGRMVEEAVDTQLEAIGWGLMELRVFKRGDEAARAAIEAEAARQISQFHSYLMRTLGDAPYFGGDAFLRADMAVISHLLGPARPGPETPLGAWVARCLERPSVSRTAKEAADSIAGMANVDAAVKGGLFKRQYRDHRLEWMMRSGGVQIVLDGLKTSTIRYSTEIA
ncbi:MAG: glutathione S-transferase family protein, partial [Hyphomonadaceae bacterium]|nr:glutathione S-transferase family protein [Hyphomonadaceae bacterium]